MKIIKNIDFLRQECENVSLEEGEKIAKNLWKVLAKHGDGIGLAANQVGIEKRVCVIGIKGLEPIVLINPKIIKLEDPIVFPFDGCLSFPGIEITTQRHIWCTVETDNIGTVMFGPGGIDEPSWQDPRLWQSIAAQHEVDHLDGITMFDREIKNTPIIRKEKKYGRNEKVTIKKGTKEQVMKYKKVDKLLNEGWEIV